MANEIEQAAALLRGILPTADSWMDAPADSFAVIEHTGTTIWYEDNQPVEETLRAQYTVWTKASQAQLQEYMDECATALKQAGWVLGPIQADNAAVSGTAWHGQTREISFLR